MSYEHERIKFKRRHVIRSYSTWFEFHCLIGSIFDQSLFKCIYTNRWASDRFINQGSISHLNDDNLSVNKWSLICTYFDLSMICIWFSIDDKDNNSHEYYLQYKNTSAYDDNRVRDESL